MISHCHLIVSLLAELTTRHPRASSPYFALTPPDLTLKAVSQSYMTSCTLFRILFNVVTRCRVSYPIGRVLTQPNSRQVRRIMRHGTEAFGASGVRMGAVICMRRRSECTLVKRYAGDVGLGGQVSGFVLWAPAEGALTKKNVDHVAKDVGTDAGAAR